MTKKNLTKFCFLFLIVFQSQCTTCSAANCVTTQEALKLAINNAPTIALGGPTEINICTPRMVITDNSGFGIVLSNKAIILNCTAGANTRCIIDAQSKSRHFYGKSAYLYMERIRLINGYASTGGAIYLDGNSTLNIGKGCSFTNNQADDFGGAISMSEQATLTIRGDGTAMSSATSVIFQGNIAAYGSAISVSGISLQLTNMIYFVDNQGEVCCSIIV